MDLSRGIRYSTRLPSIEAYDLGSNLPPKHHKAPPAIQTYSVAEFARDVTKNKIRAPFAPVSKPKPTPPRSRNPSLSHGKSEHSEIDDDLKQELKKRFVELFGALDDDE